MSSSLFATTLTYHAARRSVIRSVRSTPLRRPPHGPGGPHEDRAPRQRPARPHRRRRRPSAASAPSSSPSAVSGSSPATAAPPSRSSRSSSAPSPRSAASLLIVLPGRVTAAFDQPSRTLVITRRSLRGRTQDEVDLAKIATVEAEPSAGTPGDDHLARRGRPPERHPRPAHHLVLELAVARRRRQGRARVPLPPRAAGSRGRQSRSTPPPPRSPRSAPSARESSPPSASCARSSSAIGAMTLYREAHLLDVARRRPRRRALAATPSSSAAPAATPASPTSRWSPTATRWTAAPTPPSRVTPLNESRSGNWADKLIARYPVGSTVTAWYDPDHPARAFLLHEWSLLPLFFIAFPALLHASSSCRMSRPPLRRAGPAPGNELTEPARSSSSPCPDDRPSEDLPAMREQLRRRAALLPARRIHPPRAARGAISSARSSPTAT